MEMATVRIYPRLQLHSPESRVLDSDICVHEHRVPVEIICAITEKAMLDRNDYLKQQLIKHFGYNEGLAKELSDFMDWQKSLIVKTGDIQVIKSPVTY